MIPLIAISKTELQKNPGAEAGLLQFAEKKDEISSVNIYISQTSTQLVEFICFLKDSNIRFQFYASEEELKKKFVIPNH